MNKSRSAQTGIQLMDGRIGDPVLRKEYSTKACQHGSRPTLTYKLSTCNCVSTSPRNIRERPLKHIAGDYQCPAWFAIDSSFRDSKQW